MSKLGRLALVVTTLSLVTSVMAVAANPPSLTPKQEKAAIAQVQQSWRAMDGETADEIFVKVAKVAHFIPIGWEAGNDGQGGIYVAFDWLRHKGDKKDDTQTVSFELAPGGKAKIAASEDEDVSLGWQAFALHLIQGEVDDGRADANKRFLHDPSNVNFVSTPEGTLGRLLIRGGCSLGDPVAVEYADTWGRDAPVKGDFWRLQLSVDCTTPGPSYFTKDGVILFKKVGIAPWKPFSFFAKRISDNPPGKWFDQEDPVEREAFAMVAEQGGRAGWGADEQAAALKVVELRNDGSMVHW
jgi:hypothetical protein